MEYLGADVSAAEICTEFFERFMPIAKVAVAAGVIVESLRVPPLIERAWCIAILHSRAFMAYCLAHCDFVLHHTPHYEPLPPPAFDVDMAYWLLYGRPPSHIWPPVAHGDVGVVHSAWVRALPRYERMLATMRCSAPFVDNDDNDDVTLSLCCFAPEKQASTATNNARNASERWMSSTRRGLLC